MPTIDWTIQISDVLLFLGGIWAFVKVWLSVRDSLRDITREIGAKDPPEGLLGDVLGLKQETRKHRDQLIEIGAELGMKRTNRS